MASTGSVQEPVDPWPIGQWKVNSCADAAQEVLPQILRSLAAWLQTVWWASPPPHVASPVVERSQSTRYPSAEWPKGKAVIEQFDDAERGDPCRTSAEHHEA